MKSSHEDTLAGQFIEGWRWNLAAIRARVTEPKVISDDDEEIRFLGCVGHVYTVAGFPPVQKVKAKSGISSGSCINKYYAFRGGFPKLPGLRSSPASMSDMLAMALRALAPFRTWWSAVPGRLHTQEGSSSVNPLLRIRNVGGFSFPEVTAGAGPVAGW